MYIKVKILPAFYFSRFKVSLYFSTEAKYWKYFTYHMCFLPPLTCVSLHEWYQIMLHDLKIVSLLLFKSPRERKATFVSSLRISLRKSLGNRKASWKQTAIPFQTSWGNRPNWFSAHLMYVWTACLWISCTTAVPPSELGGTGEGRSLCLKRILHKSIQVSLCGFFFPLPPPHLCSFIDSPDKIYPCVDLTVPSLWLAEMQTFCFARGQSEFDLSGFT